MHRILVELLRLAGLLGCGLSLVGLVLAVWFRVEAVMQQVNAGLDTRAGILYVLDAFKEPGIAFLLSALVFVVCGMAITGMKPDQRVQPID